MDNGVGFDTERENMETKGQYVFFATLILILICKASIGNPAMSQEYKAKDKHKAKWRAL